MHSKERRSVDDDWGGESGWGEVTVVLPSPKERVFKKALLLEGAVDFSEYGHEHKESLML